MFLSKYRHEMQGAIGGLILALVIALLLPGCQSNYNPYLTDANGALMLDGDGKPILLPAERALLDRIEFDADEAGCVNIIGQIDLNSSIFFSSNTQIILKKTKVVPGQTTPPPQC